MKIFNNKNKPDPRTSSPIAANPAQSATAKVGSSNPRIEAKPATSGPELTEEAIRARAHQIWVERGGGEGDAIADWLRAERELRSGAKR